MQQNDLLITRTQMLRIRRGSLLLGGLTLIGTGIVMMLLGLLQKTPSFDELKQERNATAGLELFWETMSQTGGTHAIVGGLLLVAGFLCLILDALLDIRGASLDDLTTAK